MRNHSTQDVYPALQSFGHGHAKYSVIAVALECRSSLRSGRGNHKPKSGSATIFPVSDSSSTTACTDFISFVYSRPLRGTYSTQMEHLITKRDRSAQSPPCSSHLPWHRTKNAENRQQKITGILLQAEKSFTGKPFKDSTTLIAWSLGGRERGATVSIRSERYSSSRK